MEIFIICIARNLVLYQWINAINYTGIIKHYLENSNVHYFHIYFCNTIHFKLFMSEKHHTLVVVKCPLWRIAVVFK